MKVQKLFLIVIKVMSRYNFLKGNILIAGANGLIGSAILRYLISHNYKNLFYPNKKELDYLNLENFLNYCVSKKINHMFFAAGKVGGILDNKNNQSKYLLDNTQLGLNALKVSKEVNLEKVVLFGSSCMYPINATQPYRENDLLSGVLEETSLGYAISKLVLTQGANLINNENSSKTFFLTVIPNSTYGPNDNFDPNSSHVLSALINKIHNAKLYNKKYVNLFGTGKAMREFVYSDDVADAIFFLLKNLKEKPKSAINIGTSVEITIKNLAIEIAKIIGYTGKINFNINNLDGAPRKILDSSFLTSLGWVPKVTLNSGLVKTIDWYKKQGSFNGQK